MAQSTLAPDAATAAPTASGTASRYAGLAGAVLLVAFLAVFPFVVTSTYYIHLLTVIAIYAILILGLDFVVGYTGQVSLGHAGLFGVGAYAAAVLFFHFKIGIWVGMIAGIGVTAAFGLLLAVPALRVTGPYLAMVTLAFGTIIQIFINELTPITQGPLGITLPPPRVIDWTLFGFESAPYGSAGRRLEFYFLVCAALLATIVVVNRIVRSPFGRAFEALRDSPIACDCMGVSVYRYKIYAFVASAALAGLAGALFAWSERYVAPNSYGFELTVLFLLAVTMGGRKSRAGPLIGATIIVMIPNILADINLVRIMAGIIAAVALLVGANALLRKTDDRLRTLIPVVLCLLFFPATLAAESLTDYRLTVFGLMILFVVYYLPDGIIGFLRSKIPALRPAHTAENVTVASGGTALIAQRGGGGEGPLLKVDQALMQFGGLKALAGIDLDVRPGTIHGLIGPNGSGKSTMMNVLTGIYKPTGGTVTLSVAGGGHKRLNGLTPSEIALSGVARTFQNVQLFREMTALENVLVGLHHAFRGNIFDAIIASPRRRREEREARSRAMAILDFMGLAAVAHVEARNLPYGKQRMLEIGRGLAIDPVLLLLDEPAAGLTAPDIAELSGIIRKIRDAGITVILIEHHMDVVMSLCDRVTVLDFGQKIAEGNARDVQQDPKVIEAYIGVPDPEHAGEHDAGPEPRDVHA